MGFLTWVSSISYRLYVAYIPYKLFITDGRIVFGLNGIGLYRFNKPRGKVLQKTNK